MKPEQAKTYPFRGGFRTVKEISDATGLTVNCVRKRVLSGKSLLMPLGQKIGDGAVVRSDGRRTTYEAYQSRKHNARMAQRARKGIDLAEDEVGCNVPKPLTIDGRYFKSIAAASRFFALSHDTLRRVIKRHGTTTLTRAQLRNPGPPRNTRPGTFDGVEYPSIIEASRKTGIPVYKITKFFVRKT